MLKNLTLIVLCGVFFTDAASAQKTESKTKVEQPAAATPTLKKSNRRPSVKSLNSAAAEPFEKAGVETMGAQCVKLETEAGVIDLEMFPESAPETVRSFLNLVGSGAFDTTTFSRVVPGFVIQGGDLATRGKLTPEMARRAGRAIADEPNLIKHERGIVSMARSDAPNSATTNFFILVGEAPFLDGKFAAFGRVARGMETVDAVNKMPVEGDKPKKPVSISRATVAPCSSETKP
ncbi:MAG: peptidylprolyl isomerase [Acidobacteriota bacterium]|nr:peptidylprolyl isomerase [Acidobacteriota bacterium]